MNPPQALSVADFYAAKCKNLQTKRPAPSRERALYFGVAVTYFRVRMHTIIGANPFHGPVRDGKAWFQVAIAATWTVRRVELVAAANRGEEARQLGSEIAPSAKIYDQRVRCARL